MIGDYRFRRIVLYKRTRIYGKYDPYNRSKYSNSNVEFLRDSSIFVPRYPEFEEASRAEKKLIRKPSTQLHFQHALLSKRREWALERPRESATTGCDFSTNDIQ